MIYTIQFPVLPNLAIQRLNVTFRSHKNLHRLSTPQRSKLVLLIEDLYIKDYI